MPPAPSRWSRSTIPTADGSKIGSLLPYHSNVRAQSRRVVHQPYVDVAAGYQVFHDFYTDAQMRDAPARENTGLFFYRGRPGHRSQSSRPAGLLLCRAHSQRLSVCGCPEQPRLQCLGLEIPCGSVWRRCDRGSGFRAQLHLRQRGGATGVDGELLPVGQLRRRAHGRVHRLARHGAVRRQRTSKARGGRDGLHLPSRSHRR